MERVKLYCQGECRGEAVLRQEGGQTQVRASMPDPGDGLYRAALAGEGGKVLLGVMEPEGRELVVSRRLYTRDIAGLGPQRRGEAWRSFAFQRTCWQETGSPARLFQDKFLQTRLRNVERACFCWLFRWRRTRPFLWRRCSAWRGWSRWRACPARCTPSGRRGRCCRKNGFGENFSK